MRNIFTFLWICFIFGLQVEMQAQSIFANEIIGAVSFLDNPYTTGQTFEQNISVRGIGRGSAVSGENAFGRYSANSWPISFNENAYFEFTITPILGYSISCDRLVYSGTASSSGPTMFALRSSLDGFSENIAIYSTTSANIDLLIPNLQKITTAITFRLYGWAAASVFGSFGINNFSFDGAVVLPVELLHFDTKISGKQVFISWSTASERNNDYFSIERSSDGFQFDEIAKVHSNGNSQGIRSYEFLDTKPFFGTNYYRIMQTDFDGKYSYSEIRSVRMSGIRNVTVTPRTTDGRLQVNTELEDYSIAVYNAAGQEVKMFIALSSDQYLHIDELKAGLYFLRVVSGSDIETIRVVKL